MKTEKFLATCLIAFLVLLSIPTTVNAAEVISVSGSAQVQSPSDAEWKKAEKGMSLAIGDLIRTARNSVVEVALDTEKKNTVRIEPKTIVTLNSATADTMDRLDLAKGKVYANLENIRSGLSFEVNTPSAVAGVRGSALSVYVERDSDEIVAFKDTVFIKTYNVDRKLLSEVDLPEGFKTMIERFGDPSVFYQISSREFERFDNNMEDMGANLQGKMSARAEAAEDRKGRDERTTLEQTAEQTNEHHEIANQPADPQRIEDQKAIESIQDRQHDDYNEEWPEYDPGDPYFCNSYPTHPNC